MSPSHDQSPPALARALDLSTPKGLGELFGSAARVWGSRPLVFLAIALLIVVPVEVVLVGVIGGGFSDEYGEASTTVDAIDTLTVSWLLTALITACHARTVVLLSEGGEVSVGRAIRTGLGAFWPVLATVILCALLTAVGFLLIIIPGIFLSVALLFATQFAALSKTSPLHAMEASWKLVKENGWWRTFGYSLALSIVGFLVLVVASIAMVAIIDAAGSGDDLGWVGVLGTAIFEAAYISWSALVGTLLYFSWRARSGDAYGAAPAAESIPEAGPDWHPSKA